MAKKSFVCDVCRILVKKQHISQERAEALIADFADRPKERFVDFLLSQGLLTREDLLQAFAEYYQVPAFDARGYFFSTFELRKFPKDFLYRYSIIPLERDVNMLIVVASEPNEPTLLSAIGNHVSYNIRFLVGLAQDIHNAIGTYYDKALTEVAQDQNLTEGHRTARQKQRAEDEEE